MSAYAEKVWIQDSLNQVAIQRILDLIQNQGRALPCKVISVSGALVTVAFQVNAAPLTLPQITIPKAESPWIRMPTQVGDLGWTVPADAYLGGVSGLGDGIATLQQPGNLSALVFVPISHADSPPGNPNAAYVQGPEGAIIQTTTGTASSAVVNPMGTVLTFGGNTITLNGSSVSVAFGSTSMILDGSEITLTAGGNTVTLNSTGFTIDGILFDTHVHGGVTTGGAVTLGPQA